MRVRRATPRPHGQPSREATANLGDAPETVIAVSALRFGCVLLDHDGEAQFAVPNRDARASAESGELADWPGTGYQPA